MKVPTRGQPGWRNPCNPSKKCRRWTESSTIDSYPMRFTTTAHTSTIKKSSGHSSTGGAFTPQYSRSKCPPRVCSTTSLDENLFVEPATSHSDVHPSPSSNVQLGNFSSLSGCQLQKGPDLGSADHKNSDSSSTCSQSGSESLWSASYTGTSSRRCNETNQLREICRTFRKDCVSAERKNRHQRSFLTSLLCGFKPETEVDPILVSVHVLDSPGPLRLVVDRNDTVHHTIDSALRRYASQQRQPTLADPIAFFGLYCRDPDFQALDGEERIGQRRVRQFHLYHKQRKELEAIRYDTDAKSRKRTPAAAPIKHWILDRLGGMRSWTASLVDVFSRSVTNFVSSSNPWFRRLICNLDSVFC